MKRIFLFILTNLAVVFTLGIATQLLCAFMGTSLDEIFGADYGRVVIYALIYGFGGSIISLLLSKTMARASVHAKTITGTEGETERWLVDTVEDLARRANLKCPEVAIYAGEPNAFATGAFRNSALVAVSTGIISSMTRDELRAVLGHEMSHVANGDMVTLSLLQGILNAFVIFLSSVVSKLIAGNRDSSSRSSLGGSASYFIIFQILSAVMGVGASIVTMAFSRKREYAADLGSSRLLGSPYPMISALRRLGGMTSGKLPDSLKAFGINGKKGGGLAALLATHPSLEDRIEALQNLTLSDFT